MLGHPAGVPLEGIVDSMPKIEHALLEHEAQLLVVRLLGKTVGENLIRKVKQRPRRRAWWPNELRRRERRLDVLNKLEHFSFAHVALGNEGHVSSLKEVNEQVAQTLQIVAPTGDPEVELVDGGKYHVAAEDLDFAALDVAAVLASVARCEPKVNEPYFMERALFLTLIADKDVVELEIVVGVASLMNPFNDIDEFYTKLKDSLWL